MNEYPYPRVKLFSNIINTLIENSRVNEGALQLYGQEDFAKYLKKIIVTVDEKKYIESLTVYVKKLLHETIDEYLPEPWLDKAARETAEAAYKDFVKHLEQVTLPAEILSAWKEAKSTKKLPEITARRILEQVDILPPLTRSG